MKIIGRRISRKEAKKITGGRVFCHDWNPSTGCRLCVDKEGHWMECSDCPYCPQS